MVRRLRRPAKARVALVQLCRCAYCSCALEESFSVDHMNRRHWDDRPVNLAACCGTCHDRKSHFERFGKRDLLQKMLSQARGRLGVWKLEISRMSIAELQEAFNNLPSWLRERTDFAHLQWHRAKQLACNCPFEQYRFRLQDA